MSDFSEILRRKTKFSAISVLKLSRQFPKTEEAYIVKRQLLRGVFSVASNYRAACRGRSDAEFYAKLCIVVEEADETVFWLEMIGEAEILNAERVKPELDAAKEILLMLSKARKTMKQKLK